MLNDQNFARLTVEMGNYYILLHNGKSTDTEYSIRGARGVLQSVVAILDQLDLQSIPGDEWDNISNLQRHCIVTQGLLAQSPYDHDYVVLQCDEAIASLIYLLQMESIDRARLFEQFCPIIGGGQHPWAVISLKIWNSNNNASKNGC